jgi:hypothetical protein
VGVTLDMATIKFEINANAGSSTAKMSPSLSSWNFQEEPCIYRTSRVCCHDERMRTWGIVDVCVCACCCYWALRLSFTLSSRRIFSLKHTHRTKCIFFICLSVADLKTDGRALYLGRAVWEAICVFDVAIFVTGYEAGYILLAANMELCRGGI